MKPSFKSIPAALALAALRCAAADAPEAAADGAVQTVTVLGGGQTRQVSELQRADLENVVPGTSPLKTLSKLPGVNFQSADPFGTYEWSTKLSVRGFAQNQLGFTLDDVPLGDMSYRNHNGLHISRAIISEDISDVVLSQGAGALDTASTSNLGGTVQFHSRDPAAVRGGRALQSFGADAMHRSFLSFDTGSFAGDTRASLSVADQQADKWKGHGEQKQRQVDLKAVSRFGANRIDAFVDWSDRREVDYQDMSKSMLSRLGYRWDNYDPDWQAALQSARGVWTHGETSVDDAYYAGSGLRTDVLAGLAFDASLGDDLAWKTTVYRHVDHGPSLWFTPYTPSSDTVPVSLRTVEYHLHRHGVLSAFDYTAGRHDLNAGLWFEDNVFDQAMRFYSQADGPSSPYDEPHDPSSTRWDDRFRTRTLQFHWRDTTHWTPTLTTDAGFKSVSSRTSVTALAGDPKSGSITARDGFLPQAGLNWKFAPGQEAFLSMARNLRAYKGAAMEDSPFATTDAGFQAIRNTLRPETSTTWEGGWRWHGRAAEASVALYHVDFRNRLLAIQEGSAIEGNPPVLANVGRVRTDGVETGVSFEPLPRWRWYGSVSFNDARYRDDFVDDGVVAAAAGKPVVDSPRWLASSQLSYDDGNVFGRLGANYIGRRSYTYVDDNGVDGYLLWDLSLGYRHAASGSVKSWHVQASVQNLFDKRYIAAIGTNGFVTSDPGGTAQTLLPGAPRSAYLTVGADF